MTTPSTPGRRRPTRSRPSRSAIVDSGIDGTLPDFAGQIAAARSFVGGDPLVDTEGHGTLVAGEIAGEARQRRHRRARLQRAARDREGRPRRRHDPDPGGGERDPLGRRPGGEGDQPQPRRRPRPGTPCARLLLAGRGGRGRLRVLEGGRDRRGRRQLGRGVRDPVAVRELPGGAAARDRGQRAHPHRRRARLLRPRPDLQRHLRSGERHLLDLPARVHRRRGRRASCRATPTAPATSTGTPRGHRSRRPRWPRPRRCCSRCVPT